MPRNRGVGYENVHNGGVNWFVHDIVSKFGVSCESHKEPFLQCLMTVSILFARVININIK